MFGRMMDVPLLVSSMLRNAVTVHRETEIVSRARGHDPPLHLCDAWLRDQHWPRR